MSDEQIVHVVRVLFLLRQNPLEQHARGHILVAEMAHHIPVRLDGDALGNQIFFDHVDQVLTLNILRGRAGDDTVRVEVWLTTELINPLGQPVQMLPVIPLTAYISDVLVYPPSDKFTNLL